MSCITDRLLVLASSAATAGGGQGFGGGRRGRRSRSRSRGERRSRSRARSRSRSRRSPQSSRREEARSGLQGPHEASSSSSWVSRYSAPLPASLVALCSSSLCSLCSTPLSGPLQAQEHYVGARHARRVQARLEQAFMEDPTQPLPQLIGATSTWEKEEGGPAMLTVEELAEAMTQPLTTLQEEARDLWDPPLPRDVLVLIREEQCDICHVAMNSEVSMVAHYGGGPHQKALQRLLAGRSRGQLTEEQVLRCDLCGNIFPGPEAAAQHYAGKRHLKAVRTRGSFKCTTCDLACSSEAHLKEHMGGRQHRLKAGERPVKKKAVIVNSCDLCGVKCESKVTFLEHLKGRQHASNTGKLEVAEGQFDCAACGVKCNSKASLEEHKRGKVHSANVPEEAREVLEPHQAPLPIDLQLLMREEQCGVCHTTLLTPQESVAHYSGSPHEEKLQGLLASKEPLSQEELEGCEVCKVQLSNPDSARQHYAGRRHHRELRSQESFQPGCAACGVTCNSKASFEEHMRGSKHLANAQLNSFFTS